MNLLKKLKVIDGGHQFDAVLKARRAGQVPRVFFNRAAEIDWLPAHTSKDAFKAPLRPLLNEEEMRELVGISIKTFDMARLPHDPADRPATDLFTATELADRFNKAGEILREISCNMAIEHNQKFCQNLRGQAFGGNPVEVHKATLEQREKQNRMAGDFVYKDGLYFSTENIGRSTVQELEQHTALKSEDLKYVPNTQDFLLISQLHELTHARQQQIPNRPDEMDYLLEQDADSNGFSEYLDIGGAAAVVFTRLAARATGQTFPIYSSEKGYDTHCHYPALLGNGVEWNLRKGILTRYDLKIRMACHAMGEKCDIQPNDMMASISDLLERKLISNRRFIHAIDLHNSFFAKAGNLDKNPDLEAQAVKGFEKLWHSGEKLHRDTLHSAGIAYEALELFRNGPKA